MAKLRIIPWLLFANILFSVAAEGIEVRGLVKINEVKDNH